MTLIRLIQDIRRRFNDKLHRPFKRKQHLDVVMRVAADTTVFSNFKIGSHRFSYSLT